MHTAADVMTRKETGVHGGEDNPYAMSRTCFVRCTAIPALALK